MADITKRITSYPDKVKRVQDTYSGIPDIGLLLEKYKTGDVKEDTKTTIQQFGNYELMLNMCSNNIGKLLLDIADDIKNIDTIDAPESTRMTSKLQLEQLLTVLNTTNKSISEQKQNLSLAKEALKVAKVQSDIKDIHSIPKIPIVGRKRETV